MSNVTIYFMLACVHLKIFILLLSLFEILNKELKYIKLKVETLTTELL